MQTILGSTGVVGLGIAKTLPQYTDKIRLVSRNPKKVNPNDELFPADLNNTGQIQEATKNSDVVYLTAGLRYNLKIWQAQWPVIMKNVIEACKKNNSKLVFFDNVYVYGKVNGWMTEETPMNPSSKKGEVRVKISNMITEEIKKGNLKAIIVRAADFYGPNALSFINAMVFDYFNKGKNAMWLIDDKPKHSFTFTPDAGKAAAILGNSENAYNQIWHIPTDKDVLTGKKIIELIAKEFGIEPKYRVMKKWMLSLTGIFVEPIRESIEMLYQNEYDYLFDSTKFEKAFNFKPTSYEEGIKMTVNSMKGKN